MVENTSSKSNFGIEEEEWLETLLQVSSQRKKQMFWVSLRSAILTLTAIPFRLQVHERTIHLLLPQQLPSDPARIEILVYLPELGVGIYEKRIDEKNEIRLSLRYPARRHGDRFDAIDMVEVVISTSEGFLTVSNSEYRLQ